MKIEILYPEICNLYGDSFNAIYLKKCLKDATFIETSINEEPRFVKEDIDLVYLGTTTESNQELIIEKLKPYKKEIKKYIDDNKKLLATGNSLEMFEEYIIDKEKKIEALGIFKGYAVRNMEHRHNSLFLGEFDDIKILGHKSQFTFSYNINDKFIKTVRGIGNNENDNNEGIKYKNFYGTYLLGPFLVFNPDFTKKFLGIDRLPFEEATYESYNYRLKEFLDPKTEFISKH